MQYQSITIFSPSSKYVHGGSIHPVQEATEVVVFIWAADKLNIYEKGSDGQEEKKVEGRGKWKSTWIGLEKGLEPDLRHQQKCTSNICGYITIYASTCWAA